MDFVTWIRAQLDRTVGVVAGFGGLVAIIAGWAGVSRTAYPVEQTPYLVSGGILGVFLIVVAAVLWLSADLHDEWRKLDRIEERLDEIVDQRLGNALGTSLASQGSLPERHVELTLEGRANGS